MSPAYSAYRMALLAHNRVSVVALCRFDQRRTFVSIVDYEGVVFSDGRPRPARHVLKIHKLPVGHVRFFQSQVIARGGRDIQAGALVKVGLWPFIAKNVLPVIGTERTGIFPLRINCSIAFANGDPSVLTGGNSWALVGF